MRVGPSRLALIDVARQFGQEAVLPHQRMLPRRRALPDQAGSRCLTSPPAVPQLLFCFNNQTLLMLALWSCGRRASVVQAQRQIHRVLPAACTSRYRIRGSSPSIDCGFDARRTSHPVAVLRAAGTTIPHSQGHRARKGGSTLYCGISQPLFATVHPPGSTGLIRPRGTRDMISPSRVPQTGFRTAPAGISPWVTYLERAMSSLRASATIEMRRIRPRSEPTR